MVSGLSGSRRTNDIIEKLLTLSFSPFVLASLLGRFIPVKIKDKNSSLDLHSICLETFLSNSSKILGKLYWTDMYTCPSLK